MSTLMHENGHLRDALKRIIERCEIFIDDEADMRTHSIEVLMGIAEDALSLQAGPEPAPDKLWAVHAQGPDELYAAFSREDAEQHAAALNSLPMPAGIQVAAVVIPSPWPAEEHWKYATELERDHATELKALATRPVEIEQQPFTVPDGYALVPQTMHLDKSVIDALRFHVGGVDGAEEEDKFVDGILWVGEVLGDGGEREAYGLNIACAECPEEGSTNLIEFAAPIAQTAQGCK